MRFRAIDLVTAIVGRMGFVIRRKRSCVAFRRRKGAARRPSFQELMAALHRENIYYGFEASEYPLDVSGWGADSQVFEKIIARCHPSFVIEVGSWKGASAIHMASLLKKAGIPHPVLLCVDTWLGSLEFWENPEDSERYRALERRHGFPQVYFRFLANVVHSGHQDVIIPFPIHSSAAALWLLRGGMEADAVYLDASHDEDDVFQDLMNFWDVVCAGGVLFGDDWGWRTVRAAVRRFAEIQKVPIEIQEGKWMAFKPAYKCEDKSFPSCERSSS